MPKTGIPDSIIALILGRISFKLLGSPGPGDKTIPSGLLDKISIDYVV